MTTAAVAVYTQTLETTTTSLFNQDFHVIDYVSCPTSCACLLYKCRRYTPQEVYINLAKVHEVFYDVHRLFGWLTAAPHRDGVAPSDLGRKVKANANNNNKKAHFFVLNGRN